MTSTIKQNCDHKVLASVVNYDDKCEATIWCVNLTLSFTIVIFFVIKAAGTPTL